MPELELDLTLYPSPILRKVAAPIETFDGELEELVAAMFETMYASKGVGLAAPQVGLKKRLLVLNPTGSPEEAEEALALVNPTILERSGPATKMDEGCLSFPGIYAEIERPDRCVVRAQDPQGNEHQYEFDGFVSRIVQHEYDHLEGVLLVDRMSPADKQRQKAELNELIDRYKKGQAATQTARKAR